MKTRIDYVTNSSSSSFLIVKKNISPKQIKAIHMHAELGKRLGLTHTNEPWDIEESEHYISGETGMDNFNMDEFLEMIGIPEYLILWDPVWLANMMEEYHGDKEFDFYADTMFNPNWESILDELEAENENKA